MYNNPTTQKFIWFAHDFTIALYRPGTLSFKRFYLIFLFIHFVFFFVVFYFCDLFFFSVSIAVNFTYYSNETIIPKNPRAVLGNVLKKKN